MAKSGVKFKDTMAAYDRLRGEIAGRKFAPVYLLMGEEAFFIDALCDLLASTILQESERAFNQLTVYGRDSDAGQVVNLCRQMPMMGSYQVVILKEAQQLRGLDKLSLYTSKPSPTTILIVCHKEKNVDKRSQLYKSIAQHGAVLESVRPRDYEIGPWLAQFVASKGCTIDAKAQAMLTDHLGTDLAKISNELGKLLLSLPEGTKKITDAHIEQNIGISKDFNNFELCKAVTGQNLEQALRIADHFARNPKDNPQDTLSMASFTAFFNDFILPAVAQPPQGSSVSLGHGTHRHPANEQRLRSGRTEADLGTVGQPPGVPYPGAAARIRRQIEGHERGRRPGRGAAPRAASQNLPPIMERILLRNGIPEPMPRIEGTYLYQTLHVRGRRPLWLDRHTELLARNIQELFGLRWAPDLRRLEAEIAALLDANRHPVAGSSFVRMAFTPAGDLLLIPGAVSFYDGYALRSLRPAAAVVNYGVPYPEYPTSAREAACMLALQAAVTADNRAAEADIERAAVRTGVQAVIRCDGEGFVHVCDEAPLFAVKGKKVYTPPAPPSVERELACRAVEAARLPLLELEIGREQLARFDEIFYVDHRGLTSLSACEGQLYAAIITERIARVLNKLY